MLKKNLCLGLGLLLSAVFPCCSLNAQQQTGQNPSVATESQGIESASGPAGTQSQAAPPAPDASQYTQNNDSMSLENSIADFNRQYCPPEKPITEISEFSLVRLARAELIKRSDIERYRNMVMVDGKVYVKDDKPNPDPNEKPDNKPVGQPGRNLLGDFVATCGELEDNKIRGNTEGNQKPEKTLPLKRRKVIYRDRENQLREMEVYSPPKNPAQKKKIAGKKAKKVKDYATTILVPKDVSSRDAAAFEDMPSADNWVDDNPTGQTREQKP